MINEFLLEAVKSVGIDVITNACMRVIDKIHAHGIEQVLTEIGDFTSRFEIDSENLSDAMTRVLSRDNMARLAKVIKDEPGYDLKDKMMAELQVMMQEYEIPYTEATTYSDIILCAILSEIQKISPEKYDRMYLSDMKAEVQQLRRNTAERLDSFERTLKLMQEHQIQYVTADSLNKNLHRETVNPQIGIEFFRVDDDDFRNELKKQACEETVYIKARCKEEAVYCTIYELWQQGDKRPVFLIKKEEDWERLSGKESKGNIYIPDFIADKIVAIPDNTNIFIYTDQTPLISKNPIKLRPRTYETIATALEESGMEHDEAYRMVSETHGLYIPLKRKIFKGAYVKHPRWIDELPQNVLQTAMLTSQWTDAEGDQHFIETLSGLKYKDFLNMVLKYSKDEEPFIHISKNRGYQECCLANTSNTWDYVDLDTDSEINLEIWQRYKRLFVEVFSDAEKLLTYTSQEKIVAQLKGEKLYWSSELRLGIIKSLIVKTCYKKDRRCQNAADALVKEVLKSVTTPERWKYIACFFPNLCEASPAAVLNKLEDENRKPTGLMDVLKGSSDDDLFGRHDDYYFVAGIEKILVLPEYATSALMWLLRLDDFGDEIIQSLIKPVLNRVFFVWRNVTALATDEKQNIAKQAFDVDHNFWNVLYEAIPIYHNVISDFSAPDYRTYVKPSAIECGDAYKLITEYIRLLILHLEANSFRYKQFMELYSKLNDELRALFTARFITDIDQMDDDGKLIIYNCIRETIYDHRYFSSTEWAMEEELLSRLTELMEKIKFENPAYYYECYFGGNNNTVLLHPVVRDEEDRRNLNELEIEKIRGQKVKEFQNEKYDLAVLARLCTKESWSCLGKAIAEHWHPLGFDTQAFTALYEAQSGKHGMALQYLEALAGKGVDVFHCIDKLQPYIDFPYEFWIDIYKIEAAHAKGIPLIAGAPEKMKRDFWKTFNCLPLDYLKWGIDECGEYGSAENYLLLLYSAHRKHNLTIEELYKKMLVLGRLEIGTGDTSSVYYLKELLQPIQKAYINDREKSSNIASIEFQYFGGLDWDDMRCFQKVIKQDPILYAELVDIVFKPDDNREYREVPLDAHHIEILRRFYLEAKFCPAETDGHVLYDDLKCWTDEFLKQLESNHQSHLFGRLMGRLCAYSPAGNDGYKPCEAVRQIIEEYADDSFIRHYKDELYTIRGAHSTSAGRGEKKLANQFREEADQFKVRYPKTSRIYYELYDEYMNDAASERKRAENSYF